MNRANTAIILDNHRLFADAFANMLESFQVFQSYYTFYKISDVIDFLIHSKTQQIYLFADYYLPEATFTVYINELRRISKNLKIILVSSITNPTLINNVLSYKIEGLLSKSAQAREIIDCMTVIQNGEHFVSPFIREIIKDNPYVDTIPFTSRETEILLYFSKGLTVDATASALNLSRHTIAAHRRKMMEKAKVKNITELLIFAQKLGLF